MQCDQVHALIQDYLDGELAPADREALEEHASLCVGCSNLLDAYQRLMGAAAELPAPEPSADLADRIASAVEADGAPRCGRRRRRWLWTAAAIVLFVVLLRHQKPEPATPPAPTPNTLGELASAVEALGASAAGLARVGQDLIAPMNAAQKDASDVAAGVVDGGQAALREAGDDLLAGLRPFGQVALESFGFLWSTGPGNGS